MITDEALRAALTEGLRASIELDVLLDQTSHPILSERTQEIDNALAIQHLSDCSHHDAPTEAARHCNCGAWAELLALDATRETKL